MTDRRERWSRLFLAGALVLLAATASLALRGARNAVDFPVTEDGYYSLSVARNLALGRGITIDGEHPTNGFQPLFTLLCVPAFLASGGERVLGMRLVLLLHWLTYAGAAWVLARTVSRALPDDADAPARKLAARATAFLYLASFSAFLIHFNGLETGLLLLLYACAWRFRAAKPLTSKRRHAAFGALLGLCVLARIDAVFLVVLASLTAAASGAANGARERLARFALVGGAAFLVSAPWWAWNLHLSGSLMPSSGTAQEIPLGDLTPELRERRLWFAATESLELATSWLHLPLVQPLADAAGAPGLADTNPRKGWLQAVVVARAALAALLLGGGALLAALAAKRPGGERARRALGFGALLGLFALVLVGWYAWRSFATHHYWRYFAVILLVSAAAAAVLVARACALRPRLALLFVVLTIVPVPLASGLAWTERMTLHRYKGRRNSYYEQQVALVERGVPPGEAVASRNSGTLGFFRDRVVNLDGKVNPAALAHRDDLGRYLDEQGVRWLCDWPEHVELALGPDPAARGWEQVDREGGFRLWRRTGP